MAERQETSVMVSIQEILRDAQHREEQEKVEAEKRARDDEQRRLDDVRRKQQEEEARLRAEDDERQRKAFEEQKRQAELSAMQEAAVQRARSEAEAQARLAEMTARQEHERQLHALGQDKHKKRLQLFLGGLAALLLVLAVGGGILIKNQVDKTNVAEAKARELQDQKDQVEAAQQKLQAELENTKDPEKIAALQAQRDELQHKLDAVKSQMGGPSTPTPGPRAGGGGGGGGGPAAGGGGGGGGSKPRPACNCTPGDPLCSCL